MTPTEFQRQTGVSHDTLDRLKRYADLLSKWNTRINLVARGSLDALAGASCVTGALVDAAVKERIDASAGAPVILDLGSGAGFPGLVLGIMGAGSLHLVEADQRKAAFLREVSRETEAGARVHSCRIEALDPFPVDVVTARALAPLPRLLDYAMPYLTPSARTRRPLGLFLKGASVAQELTDARERWHIDIETRPSATDPDGVILSLWLPPVGEGDR